MYLVSEQREFANVSHLIKAGLPTAVPGMTINKVCGSGLKAVMLAANAIIAGDAEIVVASGRSSISSTCAAS